MDIGRTGSLVAMAIDSNEKMMEKVRDMCWTYILRMDNGKYYTGITGDLDRRITEHRAGRSKSTKRYLPVELIWVMISDNRKEARALEVKIKSRGARRFLKTYG